MALKLTDKNKQPMIFRQNQTGAVLTKGKREVHLIFKSVTEGQRAREFVAKKSFNQIFSKGRKIRTLGSNVSYIKF